MGVVFLSTEVQGAVAKVVKKVFWSDAHCRHCLRHKRERTEVAQQSEPGGSCGQAEGLQVKTPKYWLFIDDEEEDIVAVSEDEVANQSTPGDGTGNDLSDLMNDKQHDERPTGSTSGQLDDASTATENEDEMSSSRQTRQPQPPAYLRDYLRTVRETARYSPTEIGSVGWFDSEDGQFQPSCFLPFSFAVGDTNRIQLDLRYEIHVGW